MPRNATPGRFTPFTFLRTAEGEAWLEPIVREKEDPKPCCPKCRRGTKAHGIQPCGYKDFRTGCPNESCEHHVRAT